MIHAIIDIGSNTVRMAVYEIKDGSVDMLMKKKHMVGLAAYLKDGVMQQQGIDKLCEVLDEYNAFLRSFHIENVSAFTTAALRNAKNSKEAVSQIVERSGIDVLVISGEQEAEFDFIGATHSLPNTDGLLVDIGGASTELVVYADNKIQSKASLLMGSLYFHTKYVQGILPTAEEGGKIAAEAREQLDEWAEEYGDIKSSEICGIGGSFKGAMALYNAYHGLKKSNTVMEAAELSKMIGDFCCGEDITQDKAVFLMRTVPERLHTIVPGMIVADEIAKRFGVEKIHYSDSGVREGYIYDKILGK